jgi:hypothetical protein
MGRNKIIVLSTVALAIALACSVSMGPPQQPQNAAPTFDATKVTLEMQSTALANQLTQAALNAQNVPTQQPPPPVQDTVTPQPTVVQPTATQDIAALIKSAKVLAYEDSMAVPLVPWIRPTLELMGLDYTYTADIGDLLNHLNSGTKWDLIIIAAEARSGVQGEFWDVIVPKVTNDKTALIVEMWYLETTAVGRISQLTSKCGIRWQKVRAAPDSIYTLKPDHPVFNTPNKNFSLTNYVGFWQDKGGDYIRVTGGDAEILAGGFMSNPTDYGLITTCIEGRVIIQTFSDHDYHREDIQALWENYITWTLTNHFAALK